MNAKRFSWLFLAILLLLAACGGSEPDPTATPEPLPVATDVPATAVPEPTAEPTAEPTPEPTAEPTAVPDLAADFVDFESAEGGFSLKHPEGWVTEGFLSISFFASDAVLLDDPSDVEEGAVLIAIGSPISELGEGITTPAQAIDTAQDEFGSGFGEVTLVEGPTETTINGHEAAIAKLEGAAESGTELSIVIAVVFEGEHSVIFFGAAPLGQETDYNAVLDAIINTAVLFEPTPSELDSIDGSLSDVTNEGFALLGETVTGNVPAEGKSGWDFSGLADQPVDIVVIPTADDLDVVIDVVDLLGESILPDGEVDSEFGREEILGLTLPEDGLYTVVVRGFAGGTGEYTLSIIEAGGESSGTTGTPIVGTTGGELVYAQTGTGSLAESDTATWTFTAQALDVVDVLAVTTDGELDLVLDLVDSTGTSLLDEGELDESFSQEHIRLVIIPADGEYTVVLRPFGSAGGDYDVTVSAANDGGPGSILFAYDSLEEGETHAFPFTAPEGAVVRVMVEPADGFDVVLSLYNNSTAEEITSVDLSFGIEEYTFVVPSADDYYFQVAAYTSTDIGDYDVLLVGGPEVFFELAYGDFVVGRLGDEGFLDYYMALGEGEDFIIDVTPFDDDLDIVIQILALDGTILQESDEFLPGGAENLQYFFTAEETLIVRILGLDSTGAFSFEIQ